MASRGNLEKIITMIPALLEYAKENQNDGISIKEFKKTWNLRSNKEVFTILEASMEILNHSNIEISYLINKQKIYFSLPENISNRKIKLQLPLNIKDLELLNEVLKDYPEILEKVIQKFPFTFIKDKEIMNPLKKEIEECITYNQNSSNTKKKEVIFLYKKPLHLHLEVKKVIPLSIKEIKNSFYIAGYDVLDLNIIKTYKLERIISITKIIETQLPISYNNNEIELYFEKILKNQNTAQTIIFAYHPCIEINFQNIFEFEKIPNTIYSIKDDEWKLGKIVTEFPNAFLEKVIPFVKFIYIVEPKELNSKIQEYCKKILNRL